MKFVAFVVAACASFLVVAGEPPFEIVSATRGGVGCLKLAGELAYMGRTGSVEIYDVGDLLSAPPGSEPPAPTMLGMCRTGDIVYNLIVRDGIVYLAADAAGFQVIDARDPQTPVRAFQYKASGPVQDLDIDGDRAYVTWGDVAAQRGGVLIFDLSNPVAPVFLSEYPTGAAHVIAAANSVAFFSCRRDVDWRDPGDFLVVDFNDPANPVTLKTVHGTVARYTDREGDLVAFSFWSYSGGATFSLYRMPEIDTPLYEAPERDPAPCFVTGGYALAPSADGSFDDILQIPAQGPPVVAGRALECNAYVSYCGDVQGARLVRASAYGDFAMMDFSNPAHPQCVKMALDHSGSMSDKIELRDDMAFVTSATYVPNKWPGLYQGTVTFYDVSDKADPVVTGTLVREFATIGYYCKGCWTSAVAGNRLYGGYSDLVDSQKSSGTIETFDITNPGHIGRIGQAGVAPFCALAAMDTWLFAFCNGSPAYLTSLDASDPNHIQEAGTLDLGNIPSYSGFQVTRHGNLLYIQTGYSQHLTNAIFQIVDISNPRQMELVNVLLPYLTSLNEDRTVNCAVPAGNHLLSVETESLYLPKLYTSYTSSLCSYAWNSFLYPAQEVSLHNACNTGGLIGDHFYALSRYAERLDVSDPEHIQAMDVSSLHFAAAHAISRDGNIYILDSCGGFEILTENTFELEIKPADNGSTDPEPGKRLVHAGDPVTIRAIPESGWKLSGWNGNYPAASGDNPLTFTMPENPVWVQPLFTRVTHAWTIGVSGGGSTEPAPGVHEVVANEPVTVRAIPDEGWRFDHWEGDAEEPAANPAALTMTADRQLTAVFVPVTRTLTLTMEGRGATQPEAGAHVCTLNESVVVCAVPADGWHFERWIGAPSGQESDNPVTVTMTADATLAAVFAEDEAGIFGCRATQKAMPAGFAPWLIAVLLLLRGKSA